MHRKKLKKKSDDNKWINQYNKKYGGGGLSKERVNIDYGISY